MPIGTGKASPVEQLLAIAGRVRHRFNDGLAGKTMEKIIGVGMHKTGTTSLGGALRILGYRWLGWNDVSASLYKRGQIDALIEVMNDYDCFEDAPWYLMYERAYQHYPDMKMVLTIRRNMDAWYESLVKHLDRSPPGRFTFIDVIYGTLDVRNNRKLVIDRHLEHIERVAAFADRHKVPLLKVAWDQGDGWTELCDFLGKPVPDRPFPQLNTAQAPASVPMLRRITRRLGGNT